MNNVSLKEYDPAIYGESGIGQHGSTYSFTRTQMRSVRSLIRQGVLHFKLGLIERTQGETLVQLLDAGKL